MKVTAELRSVSLCGRASEMPRGNGQGGLGVLCERE